MTEGLLAFMTIIAVWKIVQVWVLKSRLARKEREKAAIRGQVDCLGRNIESLRQKINSIRPADVVLKMGSTRTGPIDPEWPEVIN